MELQHRPCDMLSCMYVGWCGVVWCGVELQHKPFDVLSCMSVGLGLGGDTTQTM